jgi:excisionase family DNA binding protein
VSAAEIIEAALGKYNGRATLTVPEAARVLGIGRSAAYEAVRTGQLPSIRVGRRVIVPIPALAARLLGEGEPDPGRVQ